MIRSSFQSGFDRTLTDLAAAMVAGDPERICPAYVAAKRLWEASVPELLDRIDRFCGQGSREHIVKAFTQLHCYMCQDGASSCPSCEGAGGDCSGCDGLGMEACSFCGGTGWPDEEMIPPEFRPAVREHHLHATLKQAQKLSTIRDATHFAGQASRLPAVQRIELGLWLLRLKSRFDLLAPQATDRKQIEYQSLAKHAGKLLDAMAKATKP